MGWQGIEKADNTLTSHTLLNEGTFWKGNHGINFLELTYEVD